MGSIPVVDLRSIYITTAQVDCMLIANVLSNSCHAHLNFSQIHERCEFSISWRSFQPRNQGFHLQGKSPGNEFAKLGNFMFAIQYCIALSYTSPVKFEFGISSCPLTGGTNMCNLNLSKTVLKKI